MLADAASLVFAVTVYRAPVRESGFIGEFLGVEQAGADGHDVVRNTITGKGHVLARSEIVVNCDDPMVECAGLHHILTSRHG